jgi:hypothetical protein
VLNTYSTLHIPHKGIAPPEKQARSALRKGLHNVLNVYSTSWSESKRLNFCSTSAIFRENPPFFHLLGLHNVLNVYSTSFRNSIAPSFSVVKRIWYPATGAALFAPITYFSDNCST